ncbi:putative ATP synthase YscN [Carnimonas sp. R-84981]|uniref:FliI/YscN family ATPase n=1 Tax=Carnimonas bestiolae TaxID=3402172 RepID=UPI003EDBF204
MTSRIGSRLSEIDDRLSQAAERLSTSDLHPLRGKVRRIRGPLLYAAIDNVAMGEFCQIMDPVSGASVAAEVIGFDNDEAILSPLGDLRGLSLRSEVVGSGNQQRIAVNHAMLGHVIDAMGNDLDTGVPVAGSLAANGEMRAIYSHPPGPLERQLITQPLGVGVRAIDALTTIANGQRMGIFGAAGAGKSTLLASIMKYNQADVTVLALVGERGREVRELLERHLDEEARSRMVCVVATSDRPAVERARAAFVATTVAEYFRDQGCDTLLVVDSLTRYARAQRELGLAAGEPPARRGYPPSLFATLPQLLERAGPGAKRNITAIYSVLTEGEDETDPIAEEARSLLDGHIVLSSTLAAQNHFPAIDISASRSRLMDSVITAEHREHAAQVRQWISRYSELELLIQLGEYVAGSDREADTAIAKKTPIRDFLRQHWDDYQRLAATESSLRSLVHDDD